MLKVVPIFVLMALGSSCASESTPLFATSQLYQQEPTVKISRPNAQESLEKPISMVSASQSAKQERLADAYLGDLYDGIAKANSISESRPKPEESRLATQLVAIAAEFNLNEEVTWDLYRSFLVRIVNDRLTLESEIDYLLRESITSAGSARRRAD